MDLMTLLPPIYSESTTMKDLQSILSNEINTLASGFGETIDECFINTASSLLSRYEKIYGLTVDVSKSDEFRRERIKAKTRGTGTTTKKMIIDTAASYSNGEVQIFEDPESNFFVIKFVGNLGVPKNMADLTLTIEEIKPAHLNYTFEYVYRTHQQLSAYTHQQLSAYTHKQLREGAIV